MRSPPSLRTRETCIFACSASSSGAFEKVESVRDPVAFDVAEKNERQFRSVRDLRSLSVLTTSNASRGG